MKWTANSSFNCFEKHTMKKIDTITRKPRISSNAELRRKVQAWGEYYNANASCRKTMQKMLDALGVSNHMEWRKIPSTWQALCASFDDVGRQLDVEAIAGASNKAQSVTSVYTMVTYGYRDGSLVFTETANLDVLARTELFDGPVASLVARQREDRPGIAVHSLDSEMVLVQVF